MVETERIICPNDKIVFFVTGTKKEHLELFEKIKFPYNGYECYVEDIKITNIGDLNNLESFKIISIKRLNNE